MRLACRSLAIVIAIVAAIDPSMRSNTRERPVVSVLRTDDDAGSADRVEAAIRPVATPVRRPDAGAAAVVLVGSHLPDRLPTGHAPIDVVLPPDSRLTVTTFDVPERADLTSRVEMPIAIAGGVASTPIDVSLLVNGLVMDRHSLPPAAGTRRARVMFVPTAPGLARLRLEVTANGARAVTDAAVEIQPTTWRVLSFDRRPSWTSTFVRRALERDARVHVTSRVETAPRVASEAGDPSASLGAAIDQIDQMDQMDVVVLGSPDALTGSDVDDLERFVRRGGRACLLLDSPPASSGGYARLAGARGWTTYHSPTKTTVRRVADGTAVLAGSSFLIPTLERTSRIIATVDDKPIVWAVPLGAGEVLVSGAVDAWREREAANSGFDHFWQTMIADAATQAMPPIDLRLGARLVRPGQRIDVVASLRDTSMSSTIGARLVDDHHEVPLRLWPDAPGVFVGTMDAPRAAGLYRVVVDADAHGAASARQVAAFMVASDADVIPAGDERELLAATAQAHGGRAYSEDDLSALTRAIDASIAPPDAAAVVFPMRSAWWILPFACALGGEWYLRRRRGLA